MGIFVVVLIKLIMSFMVLIVFLLVCIVFFCKCFWYIVRKVVNVVFSFRNFGLVVGFWLVVMSVFLVFWSVWWILRSLFSIFWFYWEGVVCVVFFCRGIRIIFWISCCSMLKCLRKVFGVFFGVSFNVIIVCNSWCLL